MRDDALGIGVIGCGWWGPKLISCFERLPGSRVRAVADLDGRRLELVREKYPRVQVTQEYRDILKDPEVEAVCVAVQMERHYEIGREVLLAGKHLLMEKPMTTSSDEARELVDLAGKRNLVLLVDHIFVYNPAVAFLKDTVLSGKLGDILFIDAVRYNLGPPGAQCSVLWDLGPHDLSIVLHLFGEEPVGVAAVGRRFSRKELEDAVSLRIDFAGGRFARLHMNWICPEKTRLMRVFCSGGTAVYDDTAESEKIRIIGAGVDSRLAEGGSAPLEHTYGPGSIETPDVGVDEPLIVEGQDFLDSIASGSRPLSSGEMGGRVVRIMEAACRSMAAGGETVAV